MSGFIKCGPCGAAGPAGPEGKAGEGGVKYFLYDGDSDIAGYDIISKSPEYQDEEDDYTVCIGAGSGNWGALNLIASYITNHGDPGINLIPAGNYVFNFWGYVSSVSQDSRLVFRLYIRDNSGNESLLFTCNSQSIESSNISSPTVLTTSYTTTTVNYISATDRLVLKVYGQTNSNSNKTIHFLHSDNNYASNFSCPFSGIPEINWKTRYNIDFGLIGSNSQNFKAGGDKSYLIDGHNWNIHNSAACNSAEINSEGIKCSIPTGEHFIMSCNIGEEFNIDWAEQNIEIEFVAEIVSGVSVDQKILVGFCFDIADVNNSSAFVVKTGNNTNYGLFLANQQQSLTASKSTVDNALSTQVWSGGFLWNTFSTSQINVWQDAGERKRLGSFYDGMMNHIAGKEIHAYIKFINDSVSNTIFRITQMRIRVR